MERYTWDIPFLIKRKNTLLKALKNSNLTETEAEKINLDIDNIDEMLKSFFVINAKLPPYIFDNKEAIKNKISYFFNNMTSSFQTKSIMHTSNYFSDFKSAQIDCDIKDKNFSLENQFDFIIKYFSFNETLLRENNQLFNPNNNRLHIFKKKNLNYLSCFDNIGYIGNKNNENINGFYCLCHELGHCHELILTNNRLDYSIFVNKTQKLLLYREVYSIFYELISSYYLYKEKIITKQEKIFLQNDCLDNNTDNINELVLAHFIYMNKNISISEFYKFKKIDIQLNEFATYYYSYIIAVNLFEQFLIDEEKAIYNLNYLINNVTPENEEKILEFIDANPNDLTKIKKHTNTFKKKMNN